MPTGSKRQSWPILLIALAIWYTNTAISLLEKSGVCVCPLAIVSKFGGLAGRRELVPGRGSSQASCGSRSLVPSLYGAQSGTGLVGLCRGNSRSLAHSVTDYVSRHSSALCTFQNSD